MADSGERKLSRRAMLGTAAALTTVPRWASAQAPSSSGGAGVRIHDVTAYGAKGDGTMLCTTAIQAAIDA